MSRRLRLRMAAALIPVMALAVAACGDDDESAPTAAPATATPTTVAFDLVGAVDAYAAAIPEGFNAVGDITAFKDAIAVGGALVVDVREVAEYEEGHIEGAINIPLRTLSQNLDKIPTDRQVFVYCKSGHRAGMALSSLGMLGYDNVLAFPPGYAGWTNAGEPVTTAVPTIMTYTVPDIPAPLFAAVDSFLTTIPEGWFSAGDVTKVKDAVDAGAFLLDVRQPGEYADGHLPGAMNVPLRELASEYESIPTDVTVITYCKSGHRQAMSLPMLHVLGIATAKGFPGSYLAWTEAAEPIETT